MQASSNALPGSTIPSPTALGRLRLGELIGSGRHGVVLRAEHRAAPDAAMADVAVKVPAGGQTLDDEAECLKRFAHPHIVKLLDGPLDNGALVLEYCSRGSLAEREELLTADEARTVLRQVGAALISMHGEGWIHGDVSLNNIAIRGEGTLALIDFATARAANGDTLREGTAELAGPRRTARAELDLRCLAASVLSALPNPTHNATVPVDVRKQRDALSSVIERSDAGEVVTLADLIVDPLASDVEIVCQRRRITGGPKGPHTREFGPRPGGTGPDEPAEEARSINKAGVAGIVAVLGLLACSSVFFESSDQPTASEAVASISDAVLNQVSAATTLAEAGVSWENGVAVRSTEAGPATYAVGQPGDLAAVGDWDCNGSNTLGVYRPSTGSWFAFGSWESSSSSAVHQLDAGHARIVIERTAAGCDRIVLSR